jgi:mannose-6-phosphate isomerase-like protein (cupin superfamily)
MKVNHLKSMTNGWFIGNFKPTVLQTSAFEVACKSYAAGQAEPSHHHLKSTEVTLIQSGVARMNNTTLSAGDIVTIDAGESASFYAITDVVTIVVKVPSVPNDKYLDPPDA